ncbi:MAG: hypothetical protein SVR08_14530, partial [Spirochaetota bacterium]|nr:hypothetical protein [Spirochaetota bacterium]
QNALLKTIEEPHENVYLILVSSSKGKLLPTLISRCFELKFQSLSESETIDVLKSIDISQEIIDPIASISNGSIETAVLLSNEEVLSEVMNLCSNISSFLNNRSVFNIDFTAIRKKVDARHLIDILINIYRYNLLCMIKGEGDVLYFKDIYIKDYQMIFYLLKILLAIKMKEVYNLNIKYAFKGMLYSIYKNDFQDITKKNFFL